MRVNVYAEEITNRIEIVTKETADGTFTGVRFYLELPVTIGGTGRHYSIEGSPIVFPPVSGRPALVRGPFIHRPGDDDSSAITFWGKRSLADVLRRALALLEHPRQEAEASPPNDERPTMT